MQLAPQFGNWRAALLGATGLLREYEAGEWMAGHLVDPSRFGSKGYVDDWTMSAYWLWIQPFRVRACVCIATVGQNLLFGNPSVRYCFANFSMAAYVSAVQTALGDCPEAAF
jgi:hypothetical protein